jgi:hypothetical protein
MQNDLILATFDTTPSPHRRINAPSLLLAFAHIQGEAGTPALGICSAVVGRNGPFLTMCRRGGFLSCKTTSFSLHSTPPHPTPSLHGRINAPSLLLAFAHIQAKAGTPALGIRSTVMGRNGKGWILCMVKINPPLLHIHKNKRTVPTHHCTADAQSWRSRLGLDVGEG